MKPTRNRASRLARIVFFLGCAGAIFADDLWVGGFDVDLSRLSFWTSLAEQAPVQAAPAPEQSAEAAARAAQAEQEMARVLDSVLFSKPLSTWAFLNWQTAGGPAVEINGASAAVSKSAGDSFFAATESVATESWSTGGAVAAVTGAIASAAPVALESASGNTVDFSWNQAGGGSWSNSANWTPASAAGGPDAGNVYVKINTNITADATINLFNAGDSGDAVKTIGRLDIGDTDGTNKFTIAAGSGNGSLAFDNTSSFRNSITQLATSAGDTIAANMQVAQFQTLELANSSSNALTISGAIGGSNADIEKIGTGTVVLSGANTFTGITNIREGTLAVNAGTLQTTSVIFVDGGGTLLLQGTGDRIGNTVNLEMGGGTFNTGGRSEQLGRLTMFAPSIIDMATGESILKFANSLVQPNDEVPWETLNVYNWSGIPISGNGIDQLYFGTDTSGLSQFQLDNIRFYSDAGVTFLGTAAWATDGDGEIVPVPEAGTWLAGALAALTAVAAVRRRAAKRAV